MLSFFVKISFDEFYFHTHNSLLEGAMKLKFASFSALVLH